VIYERFEKQLGNWGESMRPFIESKDCDEIYRKLKDRANKGATICPAHYNTFRAFNECPKEGLKCIMILMDPYPWMKNGIIVADGIPMSCSNTGVLQPSLEAFYTGMEEDLCEGLNLNIIKNPDLTYLANQGVLMLNGSLTVELNNKGSHKGWWNRMHSHLFENVYPSGTPVVFMGKDAEDISICCNHRKDLVDFYTEHPAAATYKGRAWQHDNVFSKVNYELVKQGRDPILWYQEEKIEEFNH
jgi:uracil-DNA glycosylase